MNRDVHLAALRAAARVAFSVAFVSGCSAAGNVADDDETGDDYESSESAVNAKPKPRTKSVGKKPCPSKDAGKPSCESVLASTFGDAGGWGSDVPLSADAKACCAEVIQKSMQDPTAGQSVHHWSCCSASNWGQGLGIDGGVGWACTPWGPPVPPAMTAKRPLQGKKRRVIDPEPAAWIGVA